MTFKEQYQKAMDSVVPSGDFSDRIKAKLADVDWNEKYTSQEKKDCFLRKTENNPKQRRIWSGVLTAAVCLCIVTVIAVLWMKSAGVHLIANETKAAEAVSSENAVYEKQEAETAESMEMESVFEEAAFPEDGCADEEEAVLGAEYSMNPTTGGSNTGGVVLYDLVEPLDVKSISIENDTEEPLDESGDVWLVLRVSQKEVEEFAETLYNSYVYSMVEEIDGSLSKLYGSEQQFYELNLMLADGSSVRLTVSEDGLVVVDDLKLVIYMECGNEAFLNVWNACENAW